MTDASGDLSEAARVRMGARLREERVRLRLTQAQAAEALSMGRISYHLYENGHREPRLSGLLRLQEAGFDAQYIAFGRLTVERINWPLITDLAQTIAKWSSSRPSALSNDEQSSYLRLVYALALEQGPAAAKETLLDQLGGGGGSSR